MSRLATLAAGAADTLLELPVVPSFTRIGPAVRAHLDHWRPLDSYDLTGRTVVVTGATSGLGLAATEQLARCGATVVLLGRDAAKAQRVRDDLARRTGNDHLEVVVADTGDLPAVRAAATQILERHRVVHALVHNAGALTATRQVNAQGIEQTVASQVLGPFLLTTLLLPALTAAAPGRVVTVSSGGMYATGLHVDSLQMGDDYRGSEQYARAKRAQVTLNEMWAQRVPADRVVFHSMHPGWADTPGVEQSLPTFRRVVGPLLRTPAQGADTVVWLVADDGAPRASSGGFWLDRRRRGLHKLPGTRRSDTPAQRDALWAWVEHTSGAKPPGRRRAQRVGT